MTDSGDTKQENEWNTCLGLLFLIWIATTGIVSLLVWFLSWPPFSALVLLGLLGFVLLSLFALLLLGALVQQLLRLLVWPSQFLRASAKASRILHGRPIRRGEEVMHLDFVEYCDHATSTATVKLLRCIPRIPGSADQGVYLHPVEEAGIPVHPEQVRISRMLRTLRQPTRTYLESLQRHGLEPLATDSIEAKAWQALMDSEEELAKLDELLKTARNIRQDVRRVQDFSADNELLSPTRKRSLALTPKLKADIGRIDARSLELRRFGYKLYEFLNIPKSLRSFEMSNDMEATLLAQRGLSDELFEEIQLIEQAYGELMLN